jgi:glutathione synthase/RimK-type ligase-like ATP-grasp enzyme
VGDLAIFVERYTIQRSEELEALLRFRTAAEDLGHEAHILFRRELQKIPRFDALFIRALTDPLNSSFVAARIAELSGRPVLDDSRSILICCDKVHMYRRLMAAGVPIPRTVFCDADEIYPWRGEQLLAELGPKIVLKAPSTSFSSHVDLAATPDEFERIGDRFLHRADRIVVQEFIQSEFDWRVGVLAGEALYACRYVIPDDTFKIRARVDGETRECEVEAVPLAQAPCAVVETAVAAAQAVGDGLYGVDLKDPGGRPVVIEVNDNPTIEADEEDRCAPDIYTRIVRHLLDRPAAAKP